MLQAELSGSRWPFDLRRNSCLRSVQIELVNADHAATFVTQMLSQLSSACIEEVGLTIGGCEENILDPAIWNDIDAALQHSSFSGLKIVNVRLVCLTLHRQGNASIYNACNRYSAVHHLG